MGDRLLFLRILPLPERSGWESTRNSDLPAVSSYSILGACPYGLSPYLAFFLLFNDCLKFKILNNDANRITANDMFIVLSVTLFCSKI
jgi:hypothetical protein